MSVIVLYWVFLQATLLSFSGFASVPLIREALVLARGVLTDTQLNDAIAISQASPGPLGLYMVIVGYFVAGLPGAAAGVLSLFTPALLAIPTARVVLRGQSAALRGACRGIVLVSCALMLATGLRLAVCGDADGRLSGGRGRRLRGARVDQHQARLGDLDVSGMWADSAIVAALSQPRRWRSCAVAISFDPVEQVRANSPVFKVI